LPSQALSVLFFTFCSERLDFNVLSDVPFKGRAWLVRCGHSEPESRD
jgi:hypothetical protein